MIINPQVPLHRLVLSLSEALDHVHPKVVDHQQRVAYIASTMAHCMNVAAPDLVRLLCAASLHDIGLIGVENRLAALHPGQLESVDWHGEVGYVLLREVPLLAPGADLVRYHHVAWADGRGAEVNGLPVPPAAHILALADAVERAVDRRVPILEQYKAILERLAEQGSAQFHPDCLAALLEVARAEAFWLDAVSDRIYGVLLKQTNWPRVPIDEVTLGPMAEIFGRLVDAATPWTAVHTAGVTATAVALAQRLNFSGREQHLMRAAGFLHDLGKLAVPVQILDKAGPLDAKELAVVRGHTYHTFRILDTIGGMPQVAEWAAFHHERIDGQGYPFHHAGEVLTLGSRIVAVADVFTAVAEDRPYRQGMTQSGATDLLRHLAATGGLDGDVVAALYRDYDAIDALRREAQAAYAVKQRELVDLMRGGAAQTHALAASRN